MRTVKSKLTQCSSVKRAIWEEGCLEGGYDEHRFKVIAGYLDKDVCGAEGRGEIIFPLPMFPPFWQMSSSVAPLAPLHLTHSFLHEGNWGSWEQKLNTYR